MKVIKLNENQFYKLMESNIESNLAGFSNSDLKEFPGSEVSTTAHTTELDGDEKYGNPTTTDKISKEIAPQNFWFNSSRGSRVY